MKHARNFWLFSVGRLVSLIGTGVQDVALPLFILDLTGSGAMMGTFMIMTVAPRLVMVPLAGVIGDRVNRKKIMVWTDFGRGVLILGLAGLAYDNRITIPLLFGAQLLTSVMNALFGPATSAMLPDIVEVEDLTRANSILGAVNSVSFIIGPALGGIIYAIGGIEIAFLINGVSFLGSGISEMFIRYSQKTERFTGLHEVASDLREGLSFVKARHGLLIMLMIALVLNFLMSPLFSVVIPYVMRVIIKFASEQFGMLETSFMGGTLLGNVIIGAFLAKTKVRKMLNMGLLAESLVMVAFALIVFPQVLYLLGYASWLCFFVLFCTFVLMGLFNALINTPLMVELQKMTPTAFRARVFSVIELAAQAVVPLGFGVVGFLLDLIPAHWIVMILSVAQIGVVVYFIIGLSGKVYDDFEANSHNATSGDVADEA
ncbi:MAG: MFS transporter [Theionarchaea archaeon]|nr:MFS transporter [Theionarchaea archaeon]MBU7000306.1 MFS transporter [Theionarchaea archaeon]MBU7020747.1 MFS transporter [Theionarchaea archaeon]MBU7034882.1 MFS transporter [Theionarchaea archaeon]MBU7040121.1 MFS transporter [Theionarchaea archaeon]